MPKQGRKSRVTLESLWGMCRGAVWPSPQIVKEKASNLNLENLWSRLFPIAISPSHWICIPDPAPRYPQLSAWPSKFGPPQRLRSMGWEIRSFQSFPIALSSYPDQHQNWGHLHQLECWKRIELLSIAGNLVPISPNKLRPCETVSWPSHLQTSRPPPSPTSGWCLYAPQSDKKKTPQRCQVKISPTNIPNSIGYLKVKLHQAPLRSVGPWWNLGGTLVEPRWNLGGTSVKPRWTFHRTFWQPKKDPFGSPRRICPREP